MNREYDSDGQEMDPELVELKRFYQELSTGRGQTRNDIEKRRQIEYNLMEAQPEGQFKLPREVYLRLLDECKNGDVSYLRLEESKH